MYSHVVNIITDQVMVFKLKICMTAYIAVFRHGCNPVYCRPVHRLVGHHVTHSCRDTKG